MLKLHGVKDLHPVLKPARWWRKEMSGVSEIIDERQGRSAFFFCKVKG